MRELFVIYLPAAVIAMLASAFVSKISSHKRLYFAGFYCIALPIVAATIGPGFSRWSVLFLNSVGLVSIVLAAWLAGRRQAPTELNAGELTDPSEA